MKHNFIAAGLLGLALPLAAARVEQFPWVRPLAPENAAGAKAGEPAMAQLDELIHLHNTGSLRQSLRIFDAAGREVPFLLVQNQVAAKPPERRFRALATRLTGWVRHPDGSAVLRFETIKPPTDPVCRMVLNTRAKDFDKKIHLYAVDGGGRRTQLLDAPFFDYSSQVDLTRRTFDFPGTRASHFELEIENYAEYRESPVRQLVSGSENYVKSVQLRRELKLDAVTLFEEEPYVPEPLFQTVAPEWTLREKERRTEIEIVAGRMPLARLTLAVDGTNFARNYTVYGDDERPLASGKLKRITVDGVCKTDEVAVKLPGERAGRCRLVIDNDDNPPLNVTGLSAATEVWSLLFFLPPASRMPLRCGYGAEVGAPDFDIGEVVHYVPGMHCVPFGFGGELRQAATPLKRDYRWLYRTVMAVVALGVGCVVFFGMKKVKLPEQ